MAIDIDKVNTPMALLYRWDDIVLSFSAVSQLNPHSHGAAELVVVLDEPVRSILGVNEVSASSVLIPPGIEHQNIYADPLTAIFYLDVESFCYKKLAKQMIPEHSVYTGIPGEMELQLALTNVYEREPGLSECYSIVVERFFNGAIRRNEKLDSRVAAVAAIIKTNPSQNTSVKDLAEQVNISEDRLHHLFTADLGLPIHKYRIWLRLKQASMLYFSGHNLTFAAHGAGFSDAAHFSRTFSRMYGAAPSKLLTADRKLKHFS